MMDIENKYFKYTSVETVLDTIPDKKCKLFVEKLVDDPEADDTIVPRELPKTLPMGHDILMRLVHEADHKALDDKGQKVVVQLFSELSDAHDSLSKVAKFISKLGTITSPEQFGFILKLAIQPLIQLKVPPHLCSPSDLHFSSERLNPEEYFEEMCINKILPKPYHSKFSKVPIKHATCCLAAATHYLLKKCMFDSKVSQSTLTKELILQSVAGNTIQAKRPQNQKPVLSPAPKRRNQQSQMSQKQLGKPKFQKTSKLHPKILINQSPMMSMMKTMMICCQMHLHQK